MKTSPARVAAFLALAAVAAFARAQSAEALSLADRLYERSGLVAQLGSMSEQIEQGAATNRGKIPQEVLTAVVQAAKTSFDPAALRKDIVRSLAQKLSAADAKQVLAWLDADAGRRVTLAEERASSTMSSDSMNMFLEQQKTNPPSERRRQLLKDLIESVKAVEINAKLMETISLGVAVGMDAMQPAQKRIGVARLQAHLREAMPPAQLRASLAASLPTIAAFTYRDVSEADLAAYVDFNRSALGTRYNDAMTEAVGEALARASMRIGELIDATPKRST